MSLSRRDLVLTAAAAASVPGVALAAGDKKLVPARKVFPYYDLYLGIPAAERTRFAMAYYLSVNGKPATGSTLWLVSAGGARTALPVGGDGRVLKLPSLADLQTGTIDADKKNESDKFQISMEMQPAARMAESVAVGELHAAIEQCNAAIKKKAGMIGFAAPKMEQVMFKGVTAGSAVLANGSTVALPTFKGLPFYRPSAIPGAQSLKFAKAPSRAMLAGKTK